MDNNTNNQVSENTKVDLNKDVSESVPEATQPAFNYQPPTVEAPKQPEVNDMPTQTKASAAPVANSTQPYQQQPYQQPQYQQPQYQQPQYQQPQYQQPYQQPQYQQPQYQQPYQQSQYQQQPINQQPYYQYAPVDPSMVSQQNTSDGFAIASLICSIVGFAACCTVVPSLLAIIFAAISKAKNDGTRPTGVSTAGLILGIIGLIMNFLVVLGMIYAN